MELQFRKRGPSLKTRRRIGIGAAIFIIALAVFYILLNVHHTEHAEDMKTPSLPVISSEAYGTRVNALRGYTGRMDAAYMRGAILPVDASLTIPLNITTYGNNITGLRYDLRTADASRKIDSGDASLRDAADSDSMTCTISLDSDAIEEDTEYLLTLVLDTDGESIYYYMRIISAEDWHVAECLTFARYFHDTALSDSYALLEPYLETASSTAQVTDSLSHVDLFSTTSQVGWGNFDGQPVSDPEISFTDINSSYTTLEMDYVMTRQSADGSTEYYPVSEYFRVRYTANRMYLMDYERSMEQILKEGQAVLNTNTINIGVAGEDLNYLSNETGTVISFVEAGDLWEYDQESRTMTRVFSFRGDSPADMRVDMSSYHIRLLHEDETGTMDYVVYGYMPAGEHEGLCGIALYHYDSMTGHNTEKVFVKTTKSDQILQAAFSELLYLSGSGQFYLVVDGTLVDIDLENDSVTETMTGLGLNQYAASRSGRYLAYIEGEHTDSVIHILDLEDGSSSQIEAEQGTTIQPVAFMDEDLVYGIVRDADISTDAAGTVVYPMYEIRIASVSEGNETLKTYHEDGVYIVGASLDSGTLTMELATLDAGNYVISGTDTIKNSFGETNDAVTVSRQADDVKGVTVSVTMTDTGSDDSEGNSIMYQTAGLTNPDADDMVEVRTTIQENQYFVYVGSKVVLATENLTDAIAQADEEMGVVVDNSQRYIYSRSRPAYRNAMSGFEVSSYDQDADSKVQAVSAILGREGYTDVNVSQLTAQGGTPLSILQEEMKDAAVLDLTGCTLSQVLYYVSCGSPVYALNADGSAVLITGYTASNVSVYDPATGKTSSISQTSAAEQFAAAGNSFLSYVD